MNKDDAIKRIKILEEFTEISNTVRYNNVLESYLEDNDLENYYIRFAIARCVANETLTHEECCDFAQIQYKRADYYRCAQEVHVKKLMRMILDIVDAGGGIASDKARPGAPKKVISDEPLTDDELIRELARDLRNPDTRPSDKGRIAATYVSLQEKMSGSNTLKPWEKIWQNVIIPALAKTQGMSPQEKKEWLEWQSEKHKD